MSKILKDLGFNCKKEKKYLKLTVPSWRPDISQEIDVIEELNNMGAKIYSYKPGNIASLYEKIIEIEGLKLGYRNSLLEDNYKFVSKYFDQDEIANLQYKYLFDSKE